MSSTYLHIEELPVECISLILSKVIIANFNDGDSKLGSLNKCSACDLSNIDCKHLSLSEVVGVKFLKLVCKRWNEIVRNNFKFVSAPQFHLPGNF